MSNDGPDQAALSAKLRGELASLRKALQLRDYKWVEARLLEIKAELQRGPDPQWKELDPALLAEHLALQADLDVLEVLSAHRVCDVLQDHVTHITEDAYPERWAAIRAQVKTVLGDRDVQAEGLVGGDEAHLLAYVRLLVALMTARDEPDVRVRQALDGEELDKLEAAVTQFYQRHIKPADADDYAGGVTDLKARVLAGVGCAEHLGDAKWRRWMADVDEFRAALARHEYTVADGRQVVTALGLAADVKQEQRAEKAAEIARLNRLISLYSSGPVQLVALEEQWRAYRYNRLLVQAGKLTGWRQPHEEALQGATVSALRAATAYCWAPTPVEAVASAAEGLLPEMALSPTALGDLANPSACGWWWFQEPVPVQTLVKSGAEVPVVALLWRREFPSNGQPPHVWFTAFVLHHDVAGSIAADRVFATPSTSWLWQDGTSLADLPAAMRANYGRIEKLGREGLDASGVDVTVAASMWFSRFFLMAATWLRQRITGHERAQGIRQVSRRLQREHQLTAPPTVEIVHLRRREVATRAPGAGTPRDFQFRFVVHGFTRNQWYPSTGTHAPKWIDSYIKGPSDRPLKEAARVYAVQR